MIIRLSAQGATLEDADDFGRFEIAGLIPLIGIDAALKPIGRRDGSYAWISSRWVEQAGHPDVPAWRELYTAMLAYADRKGWVDDKGFIRGHFSYGSMIFPEA